MTCVNWLAYNMSRLAESIVEYGKTYSKPMCEWMTSRAQRIESVIGFREPAAKGAIVRGMRPAETILEDY